MTSHDMSRPSNDKAAASPAGVSGQHQEMTWLLEQFAKDIPGVVHAVLVSRDGIRLLDSGVHPDWADPWAAGLSGLASLAQNLAGPRGDKLPPSQMIIEREDCFFFLQFAGTSAAFANFPGSTNGTVETVLGVIAEPRAEVGTVGYEMGRLVDHFAPYMVTPVRRSA